MYPEKILGQPLNFGEVRKIVVPQHPPRMNDQGVFLSHLDFWSCDKYPKSEKLLWNKITEKEFNERY
jgi:ssDNA-binding Zn-finger/Zn-ribbon topoisomerase 1